jgi:hypothetical protein
MPAQDVKKDIEAHIALALPDRKPSDVIRLPSFKLIKTVLLVLAVVMLPLAALLVIAWFLHIFWYVFGAILLLFAVAAAYLRYLESTDPELDEKDTNYDKIRGLVAMEDKIVQNQLTHLSLLKPGLFRLMLQRLGLLIFHQGAIYTFNKGKLESIGTIHFARWSIIDGGRRLLFFSNFDGSWENYLGDFVDRVAVGLTAAWTHSREFPRTSWLIKKGATNEALFKSWARKYQQPTQVWYSAYRDLTVSNIYRNHKVALGLGKPMSEEETKAWLKLL